LDAVVREFRLMVYVEAELKFMSKFFLMLVVQLTFSVKAVDLP